MSDRWLLDRLPRVCDAQGRFMDDPTWIRSRAFLLYDEDATRIEIAQSLCRLALSEDIQRLGRGPLIDSLTGDPIPTALVTDFRAHRTKAPISVRRAVYLRDRFTCQHCGLSGVRVDAGVELVSVINEGWVPTSMYTGRRSVWLGSSVFLTLDHRDVPYSAGGAWVEDNLQALCGPCNSRKGAQLCPS